MPVYLFSVDDVDVAEDAGVVCCCFLEGFLNEFVRVMIVNVEFVMFGLVRVCVWKVNLWLC